jgi:hypothetical protein
MGSFGHPKLGKAATISGVILRYSTHVSELKKENSMFLKSLFSSSKELGLSFVLLELIHGFISRNPLDALRKPELRLSILESLFGLLPSKWKAPSGPVTPSEFNLVFELGLDFYSAIRSLFSKS